MPAAGPIPPSCSAYGISRHNVVVSVERIVHHLASFTSIRSPSSPSAMVNHPKTKKTKKTKQGPFFFPSRASVALARSSHIVVLNERIVYARTVSLIGGSKKKRKPNRDQKQTQTKQINTNKPNRKNHIIALDKTALCEL